MCPPPYHTISYHTMPHHTTYTPPRTHSVHTHHTTYTLHTTQTPHTTPPTLCTHTHHTSHTTCTTHTHAMAHIRHTPCHLHYAQHTHTACACCTPLCLGGSDAAQISRGRPSDSVWHAALCPLPTAAPHLQDVVAVRVTQVPHSDLRAHVPAAERGRRELQAPNFQKHAGYCREGVPAQAQCHEPLQPGGAKLGSTP
jgi:hypothetical protein